MAGAVEEGFDVSWSNHFKDDKLLSHAHTEPILYLVRDSGIPVIPLFVNAVHPPAPSAARCYAFGQAISRVIKKHVDKRIVLGASGGLSHFSPSHPWAHHVGSRYVGDISVDFDRQIVEWMRAGEGEKLSRFSASELIENGEAELRQWIVMLGALGAVKPEFLVYAPLYRSIMGWGWAGSPVKWLLLFSASRSPRDASSVNPPDVSFTPGAAGLTARVVGQDRRSDGAAVRGGEPTGREQLDRRCGESRQRLTLRCCSPTAARSSAIEPLHEAATTR